MMRKTTATVAAMLAMTTFADTALAWKHTNQVWLPEDWPLTVRVADDGAENTIAACEASGGESGCCEETVPAGSCITTAELGFTAWEDAQCAEFEVDVLNGIDNPDEVAPNIGALSTNRLNYITFNDPENQIAETGTLAVTFTSATGQAFVLDGTTYSHSFDSDIVFNDNVEFIDDDTLATGGQCGGRTNIRGVMTHEIGHLLGMGHACEDPGKGGEPCTDPKLQNATMNWSEGPCNRGAIDINEDDIEGFTALYGPFATFACSHQVSDDQVVGIVPFDLNCVVVSDYLNEVTGASWNFGDGGTSDQLAATHTYDTPGNYTIQVTVSGDRAACGPDGWQNNYRKVGYVRACGVPDAEFVVTQLDGLQYQMLNESNVSVYGCISDIQWDVYAGESTNGTPIMDPIKAWEPIIDFPEAGTYTVVMSLGGIAGTGGAKATFEVSRSGSDRPACNTGAPAGGALGLLVLGGLLTIRRRR
ncbi:MAG TPA: PKD domain-containing protein [Deltaproteobacteria bacterium]|nr:PKD domain-containing protein [Deltaproteobacteria bacterium]